MAREDGPGGTARWEPVHGAGQAAGYTPGVHFLFVCTANVCRSPMAAALLTQRTRDLADPVEVSSAGVRKTDSTVPEEVFEVMAPYGIDLTGHQKQQITEPLLRSSDLIIGMGRRHVQEAVLLDPPCWPQAFTLKELVRRGEAVGPRRPDQGVRSWIEAVQGDRTRESLAHRSPSDEVDDPYGGSLARFQATAAELDGLISRLVRLLWSEHQGAPT
jgi:protein-tyrosine phosphatase